MGSQSAKKTLDWTVDQLADFFRTTTKVKTEQVVKSRGQHCGDIDLAGYLANETGPVSLVLDLRIQNDKCPRERMFSGSFAKVLVNECFQCPRERMFSGSFAKARGRDEG